MIPSQQFRWMHSGRSALLVALVALLAACAQTASGGHQALAWSGESEASSDSVQPGAARPRSVAPPALLLRDEDAEEAADPSLEELFTLEMAEIQDVGEWQATFRFAGLRASDEDIYDFALEAEVGVIDGLELSFELPARVIDLDEPGSERTLVGLGDVEVGAKVRLLEVEEILLTAFGELAFPTGDDARDLGEGVYGGEVGMSAWVPVSFGGVAANIGTELEEHTDPGFFLALAPVIDLPLGWLSLEILGEVGEEDALYLTPGFTFDLSEDYGQLGIAISVPVAGQAEEDFAVLFQYTIEWGDD